MESFAVNVSFKILMIVALYAGLYWTTFTLHFVNMLAAML